MISAAAIKKLYPSYQQCDFDQLMDETNFRSTTFQRPYQYLLGRNLHTVKDRVETPTGTPVDCLDYLLRWECLGPYSQTVYISYLYFISICKFS